MRYLLNTGKCNVQLKEEELAGVKEPAVQGAALDCSKMSDTLDVLSTFYVSPSPPSPSFIHFHYMHLFKQLLLTLHSLSLTHPSTPITQKIRSLVT